MTAQDWRQYAHCRDTDPDAFFPDIITQGLSAVVKRICAGCPVSTVCLHYAVNNHINDGIWGGLTADERDQYTASQQRPCDECRTSFHPRHCNQRFCTACSHRRRPNRATIPARVLARADDIRDMWAAGAGDQQIAAVLGTKKQTVRETRRHLGIGVDAPATELAEVA